MLALLTLSLVATVGFVDLKTRRSQATPRTAAELVVEELRAARQSAKKDKTFVAIAFPSANGTQPHTASFYRLEGETRPRITRSSTLGREYQGISIFTGLWNLDPSQLLNPGSNTLTPPADAPVWDFASWGAPFPNDYHLVFGPTGSVHSSSLPLFDNGYHLLVCAGADYMGATLDGRALFRPTRVSSPYTITVSRSGLLRTTPGVLAQDGTVATVTGILDPVVAPAAAPPVTNSANQDPSIQKVEVGPQPNPATLPSGIDATVDWKGHLTLQVRATDPDGDRLNCNWTANGGSFSSPLANRMEWDGSAWTSTWEWRPPATVVVGDVFTLKPTVVDGRGGSVEGQLGVAGKIQVTGDGQIVFERQGDIYLINADGTNETNLTNEPGNDWTPKWSPDGTRLCFFSDRTGNFQAYVMWPDGSNLTQVTNVTPPNFISYATWSPNGERLLVCIDSGARERLALASLDGSGALQYVTGLGDYMGPTWNGTVAICGVDLGPGLPCELYESKLDNTPPVKLTNAPGQVQWSQTFSPDGTRLLFCQGPRTSGPTCPPQSTENFDLFVADYAPGSLTNIRQITTDAGTDYGPCWSPAGDRVVFSSSRTGNYELYIQDLTGGAPTQLTNHPGVDSKVANWALR